MAVRRAASRPGRGELRETPRSPPTAPALPRCDTSRGRLGRPPAPGSLSPQCGIAPPRLSTANRTAARPAILELRGARPAAPDLECPLTRSTGRRQDRHRRDGERARLSPDHSARQHPGRARDRDSRGDPAVVRPGTRRGPGDLGGTRAVSPGRRDNRGRRRRLGGQHWRHPRALRRRRRVPDPAAAHGRARRAVWRVVPAARNGAGGLARHARRGPAAAPGRRRDGRGRRGCRRGRRPGGRGPDPAPALPRSEHQALPRGADVVPALADRSGAQHPAAPDARDRPRGARGHRRPPRDRVLRTATPLSATGCPRGSASISRCCAARSSSAA
jgi:hypothetical protein